MNLQLATVRVELFLSVWAQSFEQTGNIIGFRKWSCFVDVVEEELENLKEFDGDDLEEQNVVSPMFTESWRTKETHSLRKELLCKRT